MKVCAAAVFVIGLFAMFAAIIITYAVPDYRENIWGGIGLCCIILWCLCWVATPHIYKADLPPVRKK